MESESPPRPAWHRLDWQISQDTLEQEILENICPLEHPNIAHPSHSSGFAAPTAVPRGRVVAPRSFIRSACPILPPPSAKASPAGGEASGSATLGVARSE